jgi:hypothetical protein
MHFVDALVTVPSPLAEHIFDSHLSSVRRPVWDGQPQGESVCKRQRRDNEAGTKNDNNLPIISNPKTKPTAKAKDTQTVCSIKR